MTKLDELLNDYTLMGDDGAVIFSSLDKLLDFIEEIRADEREACAQVCLEGTEMPVQVDADTPRVL